MIVGAMPLGIVRRGRRSPRPQAERPAYPSSAYLQIGRDKI
jgi:hypothetical protein